VADFPHLWSQNNGYPYRRIRRGFDRRLERQTLKMADVLVTVSDSASNDFKLLHNEKPIITISHGFDPNTVNIKPDSLDRKFTITYTGSFAPNLREPDDLFTALVNVLDKGEISRDEIEVRFYGPRENWIEISIEKYGLSDVVRLYGKISLEQSHQKQRESQLLFIPKWQDPNEKGVFSMKIFEYFAARRPILAIGKCKDIVDDLLYETKAGVCATPGIEAEKTLIKLFNEYKQNGKLIFHGDTRLIDKYSQREMAGKFAKILNEQRITD
jgi:glycosyltransferase involved in cell wall biosynthesis